MTGITPVEGENRVEEVARMQGGRNLTTVVLDHAREMLENIKQLKAGRPLGIQDSGSKIQDAEGD